MRLFSPRKTTLLFVIRDKTRVRLSIPCQSLDTCMTFGCPKHFILFFEQTPLENLEPILREDIQKVLGLFAFLLYLNFLLFFFYQLLYILFCSNSCVVTDMGWCSKATSSQGYPIE